MDNQSALDDIDSTLKAKGFVDVGPGFADYEGSIKVHGNDVAVKLVIPRLDFVELPEVHIKDQSQVPVEILGHIEAGSGICYASSVGLPLDKYQPGQSILRVLKEAETTIEASFSGQGHQEVANEYQSYWREASRSFRILVNETFFTSQKTDLGYYRFKNEKGHSFYGIRDTNELKNYKATLLRPVYVIQCDFEIGPAGAMKVPGNLSEFKAWLIGQNGDFELAYQNAMTSLANRGLVIVAAPNSTVGLSIVYPSDLAAGRAKGSIRQLKIPGILENRSENISITRYEGRWSDIETVTQRNLTGLKTLADVKIAVVGCGTVGSHLAKFLAQSGAGINQPLVLYDKELLQEGNLGRHILGLNYVGQPKALALAEELGRFHPDIKIDAYCLDAVKHWKDIKNFDLIIDATGDWNVQNALNSLFMQDEDMECAAMLHSWVFANGAGVQSFLNLRDEFSCFRCLHPDFNGEWRYPPANPHDELNIQEATCGDGAFIAYSVAAPATAAALSLDAVLDWVNEKQGARLRSAMIDIKRGRYQKPIAPLPSPKCPSCAHLRPND